MRSRLMTSISAIALIAGASFAHAQNKGGPAAAPQTTSPAQQSAPPSSQPGGAIKGGTDLQQRQEAPPIRAQNDADRGGQSQRAQEQRPDRGDQKPNAQEQRKSRENVQDQRDRRDKSAQDKADKKGAATTGQGAAGSASLTSEQRTKISKTIRQSNVKRVTNVNFNIAVGTVVPRSVSLYPLPAAVVEVYPHWRGYRFVLVGDEIIIIEPGSHRIVAVIEA